MATGMLLAQTEVEKPKTFGKQQPKKVEPQEESFPGTDKNYKWEFVWRNTIAFIYLHITAAYGLYLMFTQAHAISNITVGIMAYISSIGVTGGAHRLWAHRAYKAKMPLRIFLMLAQTMAFQNHVYEWCRDHRVHHKYTDTDADPHNATRGFFFSHIGWLMIKKHKEVKKRGNQIDLSDLAADPVVRFQMNYYPILMPLLAIGFPMLIFHYLCGEGWQMAYLLAITRWIIQVNGTWCVNSAAHIWGTKPYDSRIGPAENRFVEAIALGEGFHNYHHVFPWDYKAAELPAYGMNATTAFIDLMAKLGQAYDMKTVSEEMITRRALRTGDGSRIPKEETRKLVEQYLSTLDYKKEDLVWGWDDKDLKSDAKHDVKILHKTTDQ